MFVYVRANFSCASWSVTYQGFVLDLLADELVFTKGVAGLSSDGVNGPLFHLLLDGAVQHEQRLPCTLLWTHTRTNRFTHDRASQHKHINSLLKTHLQYCKYKCNHTFNTENEYTREVYICTCKHMQSHTTCVACCTHLEEFVKEEGEPVCKHLLCDWLSSEITLKKQEKQNLTPFFLLIFQNL